MYISSRLNFNNNEKNCPGVRGPSFLQLSDKIVSNIMYYFRIENKL